MNKSVNFNRMGQRIRWIVQLSVVILITPFVIACAKQSSDSRPHFSHYSRGEPVTSATMARRHTRVHTDINPSTGLGDPTEIKQYQKVTLNLWQDMATNFTLPEETDNNLAVKRQIDWFMQHPKYMHKVTRQAEPYLYYICQQVKARNLPAELALMPMVESAYNPFAMNNGSGATGLWQMMPGTASGFGLHVDWWYDGRRDISASTNAALDYLAYLGNFFNNDWALAMAAYDSGEGTVQQSIERNEHQGKDTSYWGLHLPRETQDYVPKILALATILKNPDIYPLDLPDTPNAPYLAEVDIHSQINLHKAAKMADMSLAELSTLNPGYNRWATEPKGSFKLLLPVTKVEQFKQQLAELSDDSQITWEHITVAKDTSLSYLATKYQTTPEMLMKANKLSSEHLKSGQSLLVPQAQLNEDTTDTTEIDPDEDVGEKITNLPESNVIHHTITQGETLKSIAAHYQVSLREVKFWNELHSDEAKVGSDIVIWPPKFVKVSVTKTVSYKVKRHDTLESIAKHYQVSAATLIHQNHLKHRRIKTGQILHISITTQTMQLEKKAHHGKLKTLRHTKHTKKSITSKHTKKSIASKHTHIKSTQAVKKHSKKHH